MIRPTPQVEQFKQYLRDSLRRETLKARTIKIAKHAHVYTYVDVEFVYLEPDEADIRTTTQRSNHAPRASNDGH
jgi:hypothetical protein